MICNKIIDRFICSDGNYSSNTLSDIEVNYILLALKFYKGIDGEVLSLREELKSVNVSILNKLHREDNCFVFRELSDCEFRVLKTALKTYSFIKDINESENS